MVQIIQSDAWAITAVLEATGDATPWMAFKGAGSHDFGVFVAGEYSGQLRLEFRMTDKDGSQRIEIVDPDAIADSERGAFNGDFRGSFELRVKFETRIAGAPVVTLHV